MKEVILITGSSDGIGKTLAIYLSNKYNVIVTGRDKKKLECEKFKDVSLKICNDLKNYKEIIEKVIFKFGKIDILINNAGILQEGSFLDIDIEETLETNLKAPLNLSKLAIKAGVKKIINVSSGGAISPPVNLSVYGWSKNILEEMTKLLAQELWDKVAVTCLRIDTPVKSNMTKQFYSNEEYEKFPDSYTLIPYFLCLIKTPINECSGRIFSTSRFKSSFFHEKVLNSNNIVMKELSKIIEDEEQMDKIDRKEFHLVTGENILGNTYPSSNLNHELKNKLSEKLKINENNLLITNGITGGFEMISKTFLSSPGDEIISHTLIFQPLLLSVMSRQGMVKYVQPFIKDTKTIDLKFSEIIKNINARTRLIYLINPIYLLGTCIDKYEFEKFIKAVPSNIPIILDECLIDFLPNMNITSNSIEYCNNDSHMIIGLRTFSKFYGLANERIGYIVGRKCIIDCIKNGTLWKSIPSSSLLSALKILDDKEYTEKIRKFYRSERMYIEKELRKNKIKFIPSKIMTLAITLPNNYDLVLFVEKLKKLKIIIPKSSPVTGTFLYQIGERKYNNILLDFLKNPK